MKIKTLLYTVAACLTAVTSCDTVGEDERYIEVTEIQPQRSVLLEDFTGQRCPNCPNAAIEIGRLQTAYPDSIIAVAIHGGPLALPALKSSVGDEYYAAVNSPNLPAGRIDRRGETSVPDQWQGLVYAAIQKKDAVSMKIESRYDGNTRTANIKVSTYSTKDVTGKVQVWLVEDGITAIQAMPDGSNNREYVHNHVLRAAVNGAWGEEVSVGPGNSSESSYTTTIDDRWVAGNMNVVAFVYNDNGVVKVTTAALTPDAE